jgi:CheY-like chemotaxis protein
MLRSSMPLTHGHSLAKDHAHRILVVDDNGSTRDSLLLLLQSEDYDVEGVENGREALRVLRDGYEACLILLDLMMPSWTAGLSASSSARIPT